MIRTLTLRASALAAGLAFAAPVFAQHAPAAHGEPVHGERGADATHGAPDDLRGGHAGAHGEAHPGEHGAGHGDHHGPAAINWADFSNSEQPPFAALVLNLAMLLGIYVWAGKKPVAEALQKRKDDIAKDIEEAARLKHEAELRAKKYQADLANLDKDLEVARQALVDAGKKERERLIAEAEERAQRMDRDADILLVQEAAQARSDLTIETIEQACDLAAQLVQKRVTPEDQLRLAEEFLADLARQPAASAQGAV